MTRTTTKEKVKSRAYHHRQSKVSTKRSNIAGALLSFFMISSIFLTNHSKVTMVESLVFSTLTTLTTTLDDDVTKSSNCSLKTKDESTSNTFAVRLHLIRHGETEANKNHLVCGQSESPLSQEGINQAKAASESIRKFPFWRTYTSDLERAKLTASIILDLQHGDTNKDDTNKDNNTNNKINTRLIVDKRLRERSKGIREGRDKTLSLDEATAIFRKEQHKEGNFDESTWQIPLLEKDDDVWIRVQDWMEDVVKDAYNEHYYHHQISKSNKRTNATYDVFALTHSGTIRVMIERMVNKQLKFEELQNEETDKDGVKTGRLKIPNTSITRIDIFPQNHERDVHSSPTTSSDYKREGQSLNIDVKVGHNEDGENILWKSKLVDLTSTLHLEAEKKECQDKRGMTSFHT